MNIFLPLLFHDIETGIPGIERQSIEDAPYRIPAGKFDAQIRILKDCGYRSISSEELVGHIRNGEPVPERSALITFDDGHVSNYLIAMPILKKYGYRGTFFVTTDWIGRADMVSWEQLHEMHAGGMEIGSHTSSHPIPTTLRREQLMGELLESRSKLEKCLGIRVRSLSSPTGFHDRRMESLARDAGYDALFVGVTSPFVRPSPPRNAYWINRLDMKSDVSLERFEGIARGKMRDVLVLSGKEYALGAIKTVLGPRHYLNFRRLALRQIVK